MANGETRAKRLGWFSLGLGLAQLAAPRMFATTIGVRYDPRARTALTAVGMREIGAGLGLLARPSQPAFLWARVAGDLIDVALLSAGMTSRRHDRARLSAATAAVVAVLVVDAVSALQAGRSPDNTFAITVHGTPDAIRRAWQDFEGAEELGIGELEIVSAPGGRGTEIHARRGEKLLRRFKQQVETGEIVHSDASIHRGPHPAQPTRRREMEVTT